jgi:hypothetical protein
MELEELYFWLMVMTSPEIKSKMFTNIFIFMIFFFYVNEIKKTGILKISSKINDYKYFKLKKNISKTSSIIILYRIKQVV